MDQLKIAILVVFVVFLLLGCICQRRLRSSPMSLPRFSGDDSLVFELGGASSISIAQLSTSLVSTIANSG
jgi:hypothetical protein